MIDDLLTRLRRVNLADLRVALQKAEKRKPATLSAFMDIIADAEKANLKTQKLTKPSGYP